MADPLVTIIVLCHNYGRFLAEAIESALAQTHTAVEVLVMDDGSTDDSLEVASRYADRVRVITQPNMGLERTANRAAGEASGEYIVLLSADDALEPTYVAELLEALGRNPDAAYAYSRPWMFGARNGPVRCLFFSPYFMVMRSNFVNATALTRRADYLDAGGYSEELGDHALEDWDFFLTLLERGRRGTYVRTPLLRWRRHAEGSRNPEAEERLRRSTAFVLGRHPALVSRLRGPRARAYYLFDLGVAAADLVLGFTRWPRVVEALERSSWRRFNRRHAPAAAAPTVDT